MEIYEYECAECGHTERFNRRVNNYECLCDKQKPLLTIELQDEHAVPKVFYQGKEVTHKLKVALDWETKRGHELTGGVEFIIEYFDQGTETVHVRGRKSGEFM